MCVPLNSSLLFRNINFQVPHHQPNKLSMLFLPASNCLLPAWSLKGKFSRSGSGTTLRKCLVSFQYILSILLIAGTVTIYQQLSFMQNQDLGYNKDQMLVLKSPAVYDSTLLSRIQFFKDQLAKLPAINHTSYSSDIPGHVPSGRNGIRKENLNSEDDILVFQQSIDEDFLVTFNIPLVAGRSLTTTDGFSYNKPTQLLSMKS
jgi:putative ABC transport system permease protein